VLRARNFRDVHGIFPRSHAPAWERISGWNTTPYAFPPRMVGTIKKVDYIHQNPVKRDYVDVVDVAEHWRYSSGLLIIDNNNSWKRTKYANAVLIRWCHWVRVIICLSYHNNRSINMVI